MNQFYDLTSKPWIATVFDLAMTKLNVLNKIARLCEQREAIHGNA